VHGFFRFRPLEHMTNNGITGIFVVVAHLRFTVDCLILITEIGFRRLVVISTTYYGLSTVD
jgi:hypothetical protein